MAPNRECPVGVSRILSMYVVNVGIVVKVKVGKVVSVVNVDIVVKVVIVDIVVKVVNVVKSGQVVNSGQ